MQDSETHRVATGGFIKGLWWGNRHDELEDSRPLGLASTSSMKTAAVPACGSISPKKNSHENELERDGMRDTLPNRSRESRRRSTFFNRRFDPVEVGAYAMARKLWFSFA